MDNNAELIAEAREHFPALFRAPGSRELINRLASALEAAEAELTRRDEVMVCQTCSGRGDVGSDYMNSGSCVDCSGTGRPVLAAAPAQGSAKLSGNSAPVSLEAVKAAAWFNGYDACRHGEQRFRNPYRPVSTEGDNRG